MKYPHEVQAEWFRKLVQAGEDTEWGSKYGYSSIRTPEAVQGKGPAEHL